MPGEVARRSAPSLAVDGRGRRRGRVAGRPLAGQVADEEQVLSRPALGEADELVDDSRRSCGRVGEQRVAGRDEQRGVVDAGQAVGAGSRRTRPAVRSPPPPTPPSSAVAPSTMSLSSGSSPEVEPIDVGAPGRDALGQLGPADVEAALEHVDDVVLVVVLRRQPVPGLDEAALAGLGRLVDDRDAEAVRVRAAASARNATETELPQMPGRARLDVLARRRSSARPSSPSSIARSDVGGRAAVEVEAVDRVGRQHARRRRPAGSPSSRTRK